MAKRVDISILGDRALQRKLNRLGARAIPVTRKVMRKSARRIREAIVAATPVKTGKLRAAMANVAIKALRRDAGVGMGLPERSALGIAPDDKFYYPAHVEYGHGNIPAHSFVRATVDRMAESELRMIAAELKQAIIKEAHR